jgi:hypothetical protein
MDTISIKVTAKTKARLRAVAKMRQTTPKALLQQAVNLALSGTVNAGKPSLYDLNRDLLEEGESMEYAAREYEVSDTELDRFVKRAGAEIGRDRRGREAKTYKGNLNALL